MRRGRSAIVAACALLLCGRAAAQPDAPATGWGPVKPDTILRRAELERNSWLDVAVDVDLQVVARATRRELRRSRFLMLTHRMDRTIMVLERQDPAEAGALLIRDDTYSMLLPRSQQPIELPLGRVVAGDLSHAGFLRVNLRIRYLPRLVGETTLDGSSCWELELTPLGDAAPFGRVRYWVTKDDGLPRRIEYFSPEGRRLKTVRFLEHRDIGLGFAPARLEIEDDDRPEETALLTLAPPERLDTYMLAFDRHDLELAREVARAGGDGAGLGARIVAALRDAAGAGTPPSRQPASALPFRDRPSGPTIEAPVRREPSTTVPPGRGGSPS